MNTLGRLQDLPTAYVQALRDLNLIPLWPSLREVLPPHTPTRRTQPTHWAYQDIKPLLLQAGDLTPIEKAERRVLVLANPGHGLDNMQASSAIYLGIQLLLPGEWAPSHRHTPNAVRMVIEGDGAYTTVDGEKCPMHRGDLILTPTGLWHEHGHDGSAPVVWLDVLDLPLMHYTQTSYHTNGVRQTERPNSGAQTPLHAGLLPTGGSKPRGRPYPMLRYAWSDTQAALEGLARSLPEQAHIQVSYVNPETGADVQNVLSYSALMLRPGQTLRLPARSPAQVFHVISGLVQARMTGSTFELRQADTCCAPGYEAVTLKNLSPNDPAFIFIADESPLHHKLGVYENRG